MKSDYLLKLAATEEYKKALKYANEYRELREIFKGLVEELLRYARDNHCDLPQQERFNRITRKAVERVEENLAFRQWFKSSPNFEQRKRNPKNEQSRS